MRLDVSKFNKSLEKLINENDKATNQALIRVGTAIINATEPLVPVDEGNLVGSFSISVGKVVKQEEKVQNGQNPTNPLPPDVKGAVKNELRVGFNMPYAYRLHEYPFNPGVKSKEKGISKPGYKFMTRAIRTLDLPAIFKKFYVLPKVIK